MPGRAPPGPLAQVGKFARAQGPALECTERQGEILPQGDGIALTEVQPRHADLAARSLQDRALEHYPLPARKRRHERTALSQVSRTARDR